MLRVNPWAPYLQNKTLNKKIKNKKLKNRILNENKHVNVTDTYTLRVEIRQKQTASLVLLFL